MKDKLPSFRNILVTKIDKYICFFFKSNKTVSFAFVFSVLITFILQFMTTYLGKAMERKKRNFINSENGKFLFHGF